MTIEESHRLHNSRKAIHALVNDNAVSRMEEVNKVDTAENSNDQVNIDGILSPPQSTSTRTTAMSIKTTPQTPNVDEPVREMSKIGHCHQSRSHISLLTTKRQSLPFDRIPFAITKSLFFREKDSNSITKRGIDADSVKNQRQEQNHQLPVLPHTTLVEIISFCDAPTLLSFRGVCRVFRDLEIPREFHHRAMAKLKPKHISNKDKKKPQRRLRHRSKPTAQAVRYSYKEKVIDKEHRKVWIYLRDNIDGDSNDNDNDHDNNNDNDNIDDDNDDNNNSKVPRIHQTTIASQNININDNTDPKTNHWSLQHITAEVLKLIRDVEFYNGVVFGYDEAKAKELLLQKGSIDDEDFPGPFSAKKNCPQNRLFCKHKHDHHRKLSNSQRNNLFPMYGSWRAEASVRPLSLKEALEILSDKGSIKTKDNCKPGARWRRLFMKSSTHVVTQSGSTDAKIKNSDGVFLLLAASGSSLSLEEGASSKIISKDSGIRLAEYSTVFDGTRMTCSVLLVRTLGGTEAELRVLSGMIEPPASNHALSRFSWLKHTRRSEKRRRAPYFHPLSRELS